MSLRPKGSIDKAKEKTKQKHPRHTQTEWVAEIVLSKGTPEREMRDECVNSLEKALVRDADSMKTAAEYEADPHALALQIEAALYNKHGKSIKPAYYNHVYEILQNIRGTLRDSLLAVHIQPKDFVDMPIRDLANPELIKARYSADEWAKTIAMARSLDTSEPTRAYTCRKCGKNDCRTKTLQICSADEGFTTFVSCVSCGHRWRS